LRGRLRSRVWCGGCPRLDDLPIAGVIVRLWFRLGVVLELVWQGLVLGLVIARHQEGQVEPHGREYTMTDTPILGEVELELVPDSQIPLLRHPIAACGRKSPEERRLGHVDGLVGQGGAKGVEPDTKPGDAVDAERSADIAGRTLQW